ncbi:MAG: hypothetical protein ACRCV7_02630 [Culicoidibacterales bacterium]
MSATFHRTSEANISFIANFDYKDDTYVLHPFKNISILEIAHILLSSAILLHYYSEILDLNKLETDLKFLDYPDE